ncbi:hypothetical protein ABPG72_009400 [Tetrahymena utriculariae]
MTIRIREKVLTKNIIKNTIYYLYIVYDIIKYYNELIVRQQFIEVNFIRFFIKILIHSYLIRQKIQPILRGSSSQIIFLNIFSYLYQYICQIYILKIRTLISIYCSQALIQNFRKALSLFRFASLIFYLLIERKLERYEERQYLFNFLLQFLYFFNCKILLELMYSIQDLQQLIQQPQLYSYQAAQFNLPIHNLILF